MPLHEGVACSGVACLPLPCTRHDRPDLSPRATFRDPVNPFSLLHGNESKGNTRHRRSSLAAPPDPGVRTAHAAVACGSTARGSSTARVRQRPGSAMLRHSRPCVPGGQTRVLAAVDNASSRQLPSTRPQMPRASAWALAGADCNTSAPLGALDAPGASGGDVTTVLCVGETHGVVIARTSREALPLHSSLRGSQRLSWWLPE